MLPWYGLTMKKVYYMVPQTGMIECLTMYQISSQVINFTTKIMKNWKVELVAGGQTEADVKIQRYILLGDSLSLLQFAIATMPLNYILKKCARGYTFTILQKKINQLMYIHDINILAKNAKILSIRIFSQGISMEFSTEKCALLIMKSEKWETMEGIEC